LSDFDDLAFVNIPESQGTIGGALLEVKSYEGWTLRKSATNATPGLDVKVGG
jgi:hypothetical protein